MPHTIREQATDEARARGLTATARRCAREDIEAAIRETRYITDPMLSGCVANIQGRLRTALMWIGEDAPTTHDNAVTSAE